MDKINERLHNKDEMNAMADELGRDSHGSERYGRDVDSSIPSYAGSGSGQGITSNSGFSYDEAIEARPYRSGGGSDSYDRSSAGGYGGDDYSRTTGSNMGTDSSMSDIPVQQTHARHAIPGGRAYGSDNADDNRGTYGSSTYDRADDRDTSYGTSGSTRNDPSLKDRLDPRKDTTSDRTAYGGDEGDTRSSSGYRNTGDASRGDTLGSSGYGSSGYDTTRDPDMNQSPESSRGNSGADKVYREDGYP